MEQLFGFLQQFTPVSPPLRATITGFLHPVAFEKDEYLIQEGSVNRDMFFLTSGLVNCFFIGKQGEQKTTLLLREGQLIAFAESYYTKKPCFYNVQALEPVEAFRITYDALEEICQIHPGFERTARMMAMHYNFELSHQIRDSKTKTVEERYRAVLRDTPELILRAPGQVLASYLNTTRYHSSRIRKKVR